MLTKRLSRILTRIIEHPKVLLARLRGFQSDHSLFCLTARDLLGRDPKTIIDIGANKGLFINSSKYIFPNAKIYAFEPLTEFYDRIKKIKGVTAFNCGLWDREGEDIMYFNKINAGASSFLKPTEEYIQDKGQKKDLLIRKAVKRRFDKMNLKIERPCFVKIDVEGAEEKVIRGFGERLKEVDILLVEWFFRDFHEDQMKLSKLMPLLEEYGFIGFIQKEVNSIKDLPSTSNLIFFKDKRLAK